MKRYVHIMLFISLAALLGCQPAPSPGVSDSTVLSTRRVVSMAPNITESVFALGQGASLVARGKFDDYPAEALALPPVGGAIDPNLESITALRPSLVLISGNIPKVVEWGVLNRVPVVNIPMDSLNTIQQGIEQLGRLYQANAETGRLLESMKSQRAALEQAAGRRRHPKVFLVTGRVTHDLNNLPTAGGASFVSELVALAGGDNVFTTTPQAYFEASKETLSEAAPEVILEFHCGETLDAAEVAAYQADWNALPSLPAVQHKRIFLITESYALRPGPRVYEVARSIARLLYPDETAAP